MERLIVQICRETRKMLRTDCFATRHAIASAGTELNQFDISRRLLPLRYGEKEIINALSKFWINRTKCCDNKNKHEHMSRKVNTDNEDTTHRHSERKYI